MELWSNHTCTKISFRHFKHWVCHQLVILFIKEMLDSIKHSTYRYNWWYFNERHSIRLKWEYFKCPWVDRFNGSDADISHKNTGVWFPILIQNTLRSVNCIPQKPVLLYLIGGYDRGECHASVEIYDPSINQWSELAPMNNPRGRFDVSQVGGSTSFHNSSARYCPLAWVFNVFLTFTLVWSVTVSDKKLSMCVQILWIVYLYPKA